MPLRDRWTRVFSRKSLSSGSSDGRHNSNSGHSPVDGTSSSSAPTPVTPAVPGGGSNAGHELAKTTSRLAKTLTWRSSNAIREKPPKLPSAPSSSNKKSKKKIHPSERPLTETNLKHQEMLSHFTMTFGRTRRSSSAGQSSFSDCSNISPYGSRAPSFDVAALDYEYGHGGHGRYNDRRMSSLVAPEASSGEESERTS